MLAPILLMPRAADIKTPTDILNSYTWVKEQATDDGGWKLVED